MPKKINYSELIKETLILTVAVAVIAAAVFFAVCVALVIIGQANRGAVWLLVMMIGLAGLLFLLWLYNRRYTRADRMAKKAEKAADKTTADK